MFGWKLGGPFRYGFQGLDLVGFRATKLEDLTVIAIIATETVITIITTIAIVTIMSIY